ncbi:hypothetical protein G6F42_014319 [Rhizopus arrhizus]|nr:hypothetical protein G6F42_014319 [Rhizopus arrhizus]
MVLGVGDYRRGSDRFECKKRTPTSNPEWHSNLKWHPKKSAVTYDKQQQHQHSKWHSAIHNQYIPFQYVPEQSVSWFFLTHNEGSSGTYTTSGYGSMGSPRHSTSVVSNTSSMSKPYVFPPSTSSYTTTTSSNNNNNNDINNTHPTVTIVGAEHRASHQHQPVHILHQNPTEPESQDMMDATQKESRSSYSSNEDEDEDEDMIEEEQSNNSNSTR